MKNSIHIRRAGVTLGLAQRERLPLAITLTIVLSWGAPVAQRVQHLLPLLGAIQTPTDSGWVPYVLDVVAALSLGGQGVGGAVLWVYFRRSLPHGMIPWFEVESSGACHIRENRMA